ncbi:GNAT family N-acetyltransferase [Pseudorhodoplanes sp.]|uniref:GNAT family N-acetyltransferase n=1 Tax=Pseudorhodoplanes sp. TaxID=1934341 RepID=UPI002C897243|nr:GNAT family N-acetyltransferase [Pseudorhodoplanes sp.]HWV51325.1 GNAT family N-acetyltransferase [Pseudorhodoplanes sp.]
MNFALARTDHALPLPALPVRSGSAWVVDIADTMEAAEGPWRALLAQDCFASAYQDFDLCALWFRHVGAPAGYKPCVVIGRDAAGSPLFVWPLVRNSVAGCQVASFFCGRHANVGTMLWRSDVVANVTLSDLQAILRRLTEHGIDALALHNQPMQIRGIANPMLLLPHQPAPDKCYSLSLHGSGDEIIARRYNSDTRRKLRRKERHLAQLPGYRYVRVTTPEQADRCVSEFLKQKAARLAARGIGNAFDEPGTEEFLRQACCTGLSNGTPLIEIHALECDYEILALFAGIHDRHAFSTMFNSYTLSEHARMSPGLTLLMKLVDDCAKRGFDTLNLGVGSAEYKSALCDTVEQPFDSFIGLTSRGHVFAMATKAMRTLKSAIKNNPQMWDLVSKTRAKLFAR